MTISEPARISYRMSRQFSNLDLMDCTPRWLFVEVVVPQLRKKKHTMRKANSKNRLIVRRRCPVKVLYYFCFRKSIFEFELCTTRVPYRKASSDLVDNCCFPD